MEAQTLIRDRVCVRLWGTSPITGMSIDQGLMASRT